jgi:hypothetical protein
MGNTNNLVAISLAAVASGSILISYSSILGPSSINQSSSPSSAKKIQKNNHQKYQQLTDNQIDPKFHAPGDTGYIIDYTQKETDLIYKIAVERQNKQHKQQLEKKIAEITQEHNLENKDFIDCMNSYDIYVAELFEEFTSYCLRDNQIAATNTFLDLSQQMVDERTFIRLPDWNCNNKIVSYNYLKTNCLN